MSANSQFDLSRIRVATPCSENWQDMSGDERSRFCDKCHLHVYNFEGMTSAEVSDLVQSRQGRICVRFYRRADGTILTSDCRDGAVAPSWKLTRIAGVAISAALSVGAGVAQTPAPQGNAALVQTEAKSANVTIIVSDATGIIVPKADVSLLRDGLVVSKGVTDERGQWNFNVPIGSYEVRVSAIGFEATNMHALLTGNQLIEAKLSIDSALYNLGYYTRADAITVEPEPFSFSDSIPFVEAPKPATKKHKLKKHL